MAFTYTAHTGCCKTKMNTLESIEMGAKYGAPVIEFDLNFDGNGNPVLSHDKPQGGEVTLEEAFKKVSEYENLMVNVDAKTYVALQKVPAIASEYGILDRIFFTGIGEDAVEVTRKTAPQIEYYLNMSVRMPLMHSTAYLQSLVNKVKECGAIGINFNHKSASRKLVEFFHQNNLLVSIFTVDKESKMRKILSYGADNITTRNPDVLQGILKEN